MSRKLRRREGSGERFIMLRHYMLRCAAFEAASPAAVKVFIDLLRRYNGSNNGEIVYSSRCGERIGIGKNATARALRQLQELGFLKRHFVGSFTNKARRASTYEVTDLDCV